MTELEAEGEHTIIERRDPLVGATLDGRFRIDARLAAGGFGAIYRATELAAGREVALKILHPNLAADPSIVARFRREGATLATLRDPHTVTAYELGEAADGTLYIAMELLRGETLYDAYRRHGGPMPWRRIAAIARAVCSSLVEAHARGIVHRDLKPSNIHLQERADGGDGDVVVKVLDFGIAKIVHGNGGLEASDLTHAGQMIGTFEYMAPEQMLGGAIGVASDLYTLGVVMYETLAGRLPFAAANSPTHLLALVLTTAPPALGDRVPIPPALGALVMRCLEREPADRFASAAELAAALDQVLAATGEPPTRTLPVPDGGEPPTRRAAPHPAGTPTPRRSRTAAPAPGSAPRVTRARGSVRGTPIVPAPVVAPAAPDPMAARAPRPIASPVRAEGSQVRITPREPHHAIAPDDLRAPAPAAARAPAPAAAPALAPTAPAPLYLDPSGPRPAPPPPGPQIHVHAPPALVFPQLRADPRASQPVIAPPARPAAAGFDAARDAAVRRIVWVLALVLAAILAVIVARL